MEITSIEFLEGYLLHSGLFNAVSLTTAGNNIFWTEKYSNLLYSIDYNNNVTFSDDLLLFHRRHQIVFRKFI